PQLLDQLVHQFRMLLPARVPRRRMHAKQHLILVMNRPAHRASRQVLPTTKRNPQARTRQHRTSKLRLRRVVVATARTATLGLHRCLLNGAPAQDVHRSRAARSMLPIATSAAAPVILSRSLRTSPLLPLRPCFLSAAGSLATSPAS